MSFWDSFCIRIMGLTIRLLVVVILCLGVITQGASSSYIESIPETVHERDGDVKIGVFGRIYQFDPVYMCSETRLGPYSLYELGPAAVYAVEQINARDDILHNITLGFVVVDTCSNNYGSAARSLQFLPLLSNSSARLSYGEQIEVACTIGPILSQASKVTGSLFSAFQLPTLALSSSSDELRDNDRYPYHFRLVPADIYLAEAMVLFFKSMGWNYFSIVYYDDSYGFSGTPNLNYWAEIHGLCVATTVSFTTSSDPVSTVQKLHDAGAKVVAVILFGLQIVMMASGVKQLGLEGHFLFAFTDCFVDQLLAIVDDAYINSVWIHPYDAQDDDLATYLQYLTPEILPDDPWIADAMQCFLPRSEANVSCTLHYDRSAYYIHSASLRMVDAVYVYATVFDMIIDEICPLARINQSLLKDCLTGPRIAEYLHKVEVDRPSGLIEFNEDREQLRTYEWSQFQTNHPSPFLKAVPFGTWDIKNRSLTLYDDVLVWDGVLLTEEESRMSIPESVCSYPCGPGEIYLRGDLECCWECYRCRDNQYAMDELTRCAECPVLTWPDEQTQYTSCRPIPPTYLTWTHPYGIILTILAVTGVLVTFIIVIIVHHHRERRVIRGAGLDMITVILAGCFLGYTGILSFVADPGRVMCIISRVCFNLSLAIIFSPILVKMHRIHSIFRHSEMLSSEMSCIRFYHLQMLTWTCVALQVGATALTCVIWEARMELQMPVATTEYVEKACYNTAASMLIPLITNLTILLSCGVLGFLTRQVPENYNESWYIFVTVNVTFIIWIAFLSTYFSAFYLFYQSALQAFALFLNVTVVIVLIFCPKLYALFNLRDSEIQITNFKNPVQGRSIKKIKADSA